MPSARGSNLNPEHIKKIEQKLISIFRDIYFNNPNIVEAKSESDRISEEIRNFILSYAEKGHQVSEVDLLIKAKEKGLELVESHDLIFFDEQIDKVLQMRAFLIPGMKVEFTEENAHEKVTEEDLQSLDHELCVSFKINNVNEFIKLNTLLDIRATLTKALSGKAKDDKEVTNLITQNNIFKQCLSFVFDSASKVLGKV